MPSYHDPRVDLLPSRSAQLEAEALRIEQAGEAQRGALDFGTEHADGNATVNAPRQPVLRDGRSQLADLQRIEQQSKAQIGFADRGPGDAREHRQIDRRNQAMPAIVVIGLFTDRDALGALNHHGENRGHDGAGRRIGCRAAKQA